MKQHIIMKKRGLFYTLLCFTLLLSGCSLKKEVPANEQTASQSDQMISDPCKKPDGSKFRIGYIDQDPYEPASRQLYYILEDLREMGWISCEKFPFEETLDAKQMMQKLAEMDLGPYLEVEKEAIYYTEFDNKNNGISKSIKKIINGKKGLDIIFANGTVAGKLARELQLSIPTIAFGITDTVASGIIDSATEGTGSDYMWAHVEPSIALRQLKYYYRLNKFRKLGMIVNGEEAISDVASCKQAAEETGFELVKYNINDMVTQRSKDGKKIAHQKKVMEYANQLIEDGVEAYLYTPTLIQETKESQYVKELFGIFEKNNIPVFAMEKPEDVENGALMGIIVNDYKDIGTFVAETIGKVLNGAIAGDLPCVYVSSPTIYLNLDTAEQLNFNLTFKFLMSCDVVYSKENREEKYIEEN
ncbi:MAG: ABC transporter substrate binding protein [Acetivibrio sp.]